jgi:hypothetical protein
MDNLWLETRFPICTTCAEKRMGPQFVAAWDGTKHMAFSFDSDSDGSRPEDTARHLKLNNALTR